MGPAQHRVGGSLFQAGMIMIGIQTILVGMVLTDGKAIRGQRDGAARLFCGPLFVSD